MSFLQRDTESENVSLALRHFGICGFLRIFAGVLRIFAGVSQKFAGFLRAISNVFGGSCFHFAHLYLQILKSHPGHPIAFPRTKKQGF